MNNIKERPILFSAPMVRAILDGRKTQTRRIIKDHKGYHPVRRNSEFKLVEDGLWRQYSDGTFTSSDWCCPYGKVGDRLWVRETWRTNSIYDDDKPSLIPDSASIEYFADTNKDSLLAGKNRPSIFMPRWACRINLEITSVRVERLQDISDDDAKAEGIRPTPGRDIVDRWLVKNPKGSLSEYSSTQYPVDAYKSLWESINGPESWAANPWVWVIEFNK